MTASTPARQRRDRPRTGRDRPHLSPARPRAVNARFTDEEYAELAAAADQAGLTPTGFCAQAALDAARGPNAESTHMHTLASLQALLFELRVAVNQMRTELRDQHDPANVEPGAQATPDNVITYATMCLTRLDDVISSIHGHLEARARRAIPTRSDPSSLAGGSPHPRPRRATPDEGP